MWARAIERLAFSKRNYKGQKNMAGWADRSLRVMFMKKIGIFVYRSFCVIPLFPREWFRNYNVQEKCCRNELSLPSFNFCLNDMVTVTIVSAKIPALWYVIYAALFLKLQNFKKTYPSPSSTPKYSFFLVGLKLVFLILKSCQYGTLM